MSDLMVLSVIAAGSYALRASFVAVLGPRTLPEPVQRTLDHVKPAMFAALVATAMTTRALFDATHLVALAVAALVGLRGANLITTLVAGMAALHLARLVI